MKNHIREFQKQLEDIGWNPPRYRLVVSTVDFRRYLDVSSIYDKYYGSTREPLDEFADVNRVEYTFINPENFDEIKDELSEKLEFQKDFDFEKFIDNLEEKYIDEYMVFEDDKCIICCYPELFFGSVKDEIPDYDERLKNAKRSETLKECLSDDSPLELT